MLIRRLEKREKEREKGRKKSSRISGGVRCLISGRTDPGIEVRSRSLDGRPWTCQFDVSRQS